MAARGRSARNYLEEPDPANRALRIKRIVRNRYAVSWKLGFIHAFLQSCPIASEAQHFSRIGQKQRICGGRGGGLTGTLPEARLFEAVHRG